MSIDQLAFFLYLQTTVLVHQSLLLHLKYEHLHHFAFSYRGEENSSEITNYQASRKIAFERIQEEEKKPARPIYHTNSPTLSFHTKKTIGSIHEVLPKVILPFRLISLYPTPLDRKSTRLNSSHVKISYAVFCLK